MFTIKNSANNLPTHIVGHHFIHNGVIGDLTSRRTLGKELGFTNGELRDLELALDTSPEFWGENENWQDAVKHPDELVRQVAVRHLEQEQLSQSVDYLVADKNPDVRFLLAQKGIALDQLINDDDEQVRAMVAIKGYGLEKLLHDSHCFVRLEVARKGYGLDTLVNDPDPEVQHVARHVLHTTVMKS